MLKANFVLCQKAFGLSLQQVKLSHIQIVQWSIFLFNTQVTFTVLISSFDLKKEWKFTAFLGPGKMSSEDFRANYHLKLCVSWNKRHPGKKAKFLKIFALEWNMSFFYWKFSFALIMLGTILYISRVIKINWKLVLSIVKVLLGGEVQMSSIWVSNLFKQFNVTIQRGSTLENLTL